MENLTFSKNLPNDESYYKEYTEHWTVEDSKDEVTLYQFHDGVNWRHEYAIAINGVVKHILGDMEYKDAYRNFETVVNILKKD